MKISLVIVNYNTREELKSALRSIYALNGADELEVLVVDNGSADGSQEMVRSEFPGAHLVINEENRGYSQACNLGIMHTDAPYVMMLNSDIEFKESGPRELVEFLESHPRVGAVGPQLLNRDGSLQHSCRNFPSLLESLGHAFLGDLFPRNPFTRSYHMVDFDHTRASSVDWVSGAAMMLRRSAYEEVGGFDEGYFMYVEDVDLCWRLREAGWETYYYPEVKVVHHIARASSQHSTRMLYHHHRSMYRFFTRRERGWKGWLLRPLILMGIAARFLFVMSLNKIRRRSGKSET